LHGPEQSIPFISVEKKIRGRLFKDMNLREREREERQQLGPGICFHHESCRHVTRSTLENCTFLDEAETKL